MLTLPSEVKLTFGESVIAEGTFASITTSAGSVETTVRVEAAYVYVAIPADLVGPDVTISWKTVAADGHPLDGETVYKLAEARGEATPEVTTMEEEKVAKRSDSFRNYVDGMLNEGHGVIVGYTTRSVVHWVAVVNVLGTSSYEVENGDKIFNS